MIKESIFVSNVEWQTILYVSQAIFTITCADFHIIVFFNLMYKQILVAWFSRLHSWCEVYTNNLYTILLLSYRSSFVVMVTGKTTQLFSVQWTKYYQKLLDIVSWIHYRTQGMAEICFHSVDDCRYYNSINLGIRLSTVW